MSLNFDKKKIIGAEILITVSWLVNCCVSIERDILCSGRCLRRHEQPLHRQPRHRLLPVHGCVRPNQLGELESNQPGKRLWLLLWRERNQGIGARDAWHHHVWTAYVKKKNKDSAIIFSPAFSAVLIQHAADDFKLWNGVCGERLNIWSYTSCAQVIVVCTLVMHALLILN